jgi:hypothetical protein
MQLPNANKDLFIAEPSIYLATFCMVFLLAIRSLPARSIILSFANVLSWGRPLICLVI